MEIIPGKEEDFARYQAIKKGNRKAFDALFMKYHLPLCLYAKQFVAIEDAKEIVQDIMLHVWESREDDIIKISVKQYLYRATYNRCLNLINHNIIRDQVLNNIQSTVYEQFQEPDDYSVKELIHRVEIAINQLPSNYREAFEKNRFEKKSYQEIAEELGVSSQTIAYRIQQSLKILKVELADYFPLFLLLF